MQVEQEPKQFQSVIYFLCILSIFKRLKHVQLEPQLQEEAEPLQPQFPFILIVCSSKGTPLEYYRKVV